MPANGPGKTYRVSQNVACPLLALSQNVVCPLLARKPQPQDGGTDQRRCDGQHHSTSLCLRLPAPLETLTCCAFSSCTMASIAICSKVTSVTC